MTRLRTDWVVLWTFSRRAAARFWSARPVYSLGLPLCGLCLWVGLMGVGEPAPDRGQIWDFDALPPGLLPGAFRVGTLFDGRPAGEWRVLITDRAKSPGQVLAQVLPKGSDQTHKVLLIEGTAVGDVDLEVSYLAVSGKVDVGGGLVWRAADDRNYYLIRASSVEQKVRLYRVVKGVQQVIKQVDRNISPTGWHSLHILQRGCEIQAYFDGEPVTRVCDPTFATGRAGVWTNADAVTYFDDLRLRRLN